MKINRNAFRPKTIRSSLFVMYSLIILATVTLTTGFFYIGMRNTLRARAFDNIEELSSSLSGKLNDEIRTMDTVSLNICYSNLVKTRFANYIRYSGLSSNYPGSFQNSMELIDMLTAIIGPNNSVEQIYLYDFAGHAFGTGFDNRQLKKPVEKKSFYGAVMKAGGLKVITAPEQDSSLSSIISTSTDRMYFVSLCRQYFDQYNTTQGVVEVIQNADTVFSDLMDVKNRKALGENFYVFDGAGRQFYPYSNGNSKAGSFYYKRLKSLKAAEATLADPVSGKKMLVSTTHSDYTGWTTLVAADEGTQMASMGNFTFSALLAASLILLISLAFSSFAARKFTKPIEHLRRNLRQLNLQNPVAEIPGLNSGLTELEELNESFGNMYSNIKRSHNELLLSQKHALNSKMLALQSQMNPHFLFNSLATISAMAEENLDEEIIRMCDNICDMLRYISSDISKTVPLRTEMEYTRRYLECLLQRYGNRLSYRFDVSPELEHVMIPKLIIQPLAENAVKYASRSNLKWEIVIRGRLADGRWQVSVEDNGSGFGEDALRHIFGQIESIRKTGVYPSLELKGMGLLNIFIRLHLLYGSEAFFDILPRNGSGENPGAVVTIGGPADRGNPESEIQPISR